MATTSQNSYDKLKKLFQEIAIIRSIQSNLHWDMEVMLPAKAVDQRGTQLSFLEEQIIQMITAPQVKEWCADAGSIVVNLGPWDQANLKNMQRIHANYVAVEGKIMAEYSEVCNKCNAVWREARENADWELLVPYLEKVVDMVRLIASQRASYLGIQPYDTLLNEFDPGRTSAEIDQHFTYLSAELPVILKEVIQKQDKQKERWPFTVPAEMQRDLGVRYMYSMGFDFDAGRLDSSTHPFCNGSWPDIRITSRYDEADPISSLYGILHEAGHALYEQQLPADWRLQPVGQAHGMSMHESQSLLMEKQIGRHPNFIGNLQRWMQAAFARLAQVPDEQWLLRYMLHVEPSFIRVDADEVTYPLHIILRYNIEKRLFDREIEVRDVPKLWNEYSQQLLGITPPDDAKGCLQDIHWPSGAFGYFPTYTLGAMNAAQLVVKMAKEMPAWPEELKTGHLQHVVKWLGEKVHAHGSLFYTANELMQHVTGESLQPRYFIEHLRQRYLG